MNAELETLTAEVVPPLDTAAAQRLDGRIRLMANATAENLTKLADLIAEAKAGQIHTALGFPSWTAYLADALSKLHMALTTDTRRELVGRLADEGMSERAIAAAVGVSQPTVHRDVEVIHDESPRSRLTLVTGMDGKVYPPKPKPKPEPRPAPTTFASLMRKLTELNRTAEECLTIAEQLEFGNGANWSGLVYSRDEQHASAATLATALATLSAGIVTAVQGDGSR